MYRSSILSASLALLALGAALPSGADTIFLSKRAKAPKTLCPTGTAYYLQGSYDNNYGQVASIFSTSNVYYVAFVYSTTDTATVFGFVQSADGVCQLQVAPSAGIPGSTNLDSIVIFEPQQRSDSEAWVLFGGDASTYYEGDSPTPLPCGALQTTGGLQLSCYLANPQSSHPLHVLGEQGALEIGTRLFSHRGEKAGPINLVEVSSVL